ncbi:ABC transporter ATP-binding protein [Sabulicella rubraurantiaca]|uniref:ABC transporter ATP-binding protein n=1 Tax=Sabulicella rubraurantiaca TaxID=2811429 RepID=UPI002E2CF902|nr:ABC transporter ATP-binding protein [Sabulicella rubraurantiaca]
MTPLLEVQAVTRRFGGLVALEAVHMQVASGTVHGLIGPNGAGKTTFLNVIAGAFPPSGGRLLLEGRDITSLAGAERARLGIRRTFQNLKLFAEMTALENAAIGLHTDSRAGVLAALFRPPGQRREERAIMARAAEALEFVGLAAHAQHVAGTLAYGHRRLLEIARAIAPRPKLLLLDEPAAGLNPTEAASLTGLIARIRDAGTTVILVEHHMDVVMRVCDRITVLNHGRHLATGTPAEIQADASVVEAYLGQDALAEALAC